MFALDKDITGSSIDIEIVGEASDSEVESEVESHIREIVRLEIHCIMGETSLLVKRFEVSHIVMDGGMPVLRGERVSPLEPLGMLKREGELTVGCGERQGYQH